jgi:hypothetical protein
MKQWVRRIKAAIGMGLTWGVGWSVVGVLFGLVMWVIGFDPLGLGMMWWGAKVFGLLGLFAGSIFSGVLGLAERHRRFDQLSLPRFAAWGAVGGLLLGGLASLTLFGGPGLQRVDVVATAVTTLLASASAIGSLALARSADDEALPAADPETKELLRGPG